jgi:hypothetical protein
MPEEGIVFGLVEDSFQFIEGRDQDLGQKAPPKLP